MSFRNFQRLALTLILLGGSADALASDVSEDAVQEQLRPAVLPMTPPPERGVDAAEAALEKLTKQAAAAEQKPEAAVSLLEAWRLRRQLPSTASLVPLFQRFASSRRADPRVRELSQWLLARAERHRGRLSRSDDRLRQLGTVQDFFVIGPFDNEGKGKCGEPLPPETEIDLSAEYPGKARPVRWRPLPEGRPVMGIVDFTRLFSPTAETLGYAYTELENEKDQDVVFSLASSGAAQLFIDGRRVLDDSAYHRMGFEHSRLGVTLPKGRHQVLLKVCGAGFFMRILDAKGRVPAGLSVVLPEEGSRRPLAEAADEGTAVKGRRGKGKAEVKVTRLETLADTLRAKAAKAPKDARAASAFAIVAKIFEPDDETARTPAVESARAAALAPDDTEILFHAARMADGWNEEYGYLQKILRLSPGHPDASRRLAERLASHGQPRRALDLLDKALEAHPGDFQLTLSKADVLRSAFDLESRASALVNEVLAVWPDRIEVLWQAALLKQSEGKPDEAAALLRTLLSLDYADGTARRLLASILADKGDIDDAVEERRTLVGLDMWSGADWLKLGELLGANGRTDEAAKALARAVAISPDEALLHERAGHALALMGRDDEALASFRRALALKPQNARLKSAVQALSGVRKKFGDDLLPDAKTLMRAHPPREGEDAAVLSQFTAVEVHPNGLASRLTHLVARAQTTRGVEMLRKQWMTYAEGRQDLKLLAARLHRPDGSVFEAARKSEVRLSDPSVSIYYDARGRSVEFPTMAPGDVLEISWRLEDTAGDNLLSDYFGDIQTLRSEAAKEEYAYFLKMPPGRAIHSNADRIPGLTMSETAAPDGGRIYSFKARGLSPLNPEPRMPGAQESMGYLHVSTYENWGDVARYYAGLVRDQTTVTPAIREALDGILQGLPKDRSSLDVVRAVYGFVVGKTRYVGLEFGIHSFKPYPADKVLSRRFGDCKDKATLMHVLLKAAGIRSDLVLLRTRRNGALGDYPASLAVFDHAILYVPEFDLFLDGTAERHGSGELPAQDSGAAVLIVSEDGTGRFTTIPVGSPGRNTASETCTLNVAGGGEASGTCGFEWTGQLAPSSRTSLLSESTRARNVEHLWAERYPGVSVLRSETSGTDNIESPVSVKAELKMPRFGQVSDGRLVLAPFGHRDGYTSAYAPLGTRRLPVEILVPLTRRWSHRIVLPPGMKAAALPAPVLIDSPRVHFELRASEEEGAIRLEAVFELRAARISPEDYGAFRGELTAIDAALDAGLTLEGGS